MCRAFSGWNFVDADMLWQRPKRSEVFKRRRLDEIDWGPRVGARIINLRAQWNLEKNDYIKVETIGELVKLTELDLILSPNMGRIAIARIKEVLAEHGLALRKE
jgi:DNA-directed RNA polymerase alpha subunit